MNLHTRTNTPGTKSRRKRVGQGMGSGTGKTCGRGHKGQKSRKGSRKKPGFEGGQMRLIRRIPKRGFKNPAATRYLGVNVLQLERFEDGAEITADVLEEAGLANGAGVQSIKVLGRGDVTKKLVVKVQAFSASARTKIESAGGTCEVVRRA